MGGGGEPQSGGLQVNFAFFRVKWPTRRPHCTQTITNIAKSMAYIINQSCGDFQQGGCPYQPTSGIQWIPEHSRTSDRPQKQASAKEALSTFGSGVLAISYFIDGAIH